MATGFSQLLLLFLHSYFMFNNKGILLWRGTVSCLIFILQEVVGLQGEYIPPGLDCLNS